MKKLISILLLFCSTTTFFSQQSDGYGINLPRFYSTRLHFGFTIAGNSTDFRINPVPNSIFPDTLLTSNKDTTRLRVSNIYSRPAPGFAIGLVSDLRIHEYIRVRFTPNISFGSRKIEYTLASRGRDTLKLYQKTVESTFLIFPFEAKIQSKRLNNFSAYIIGGGGYMLDLNARKKNAGVAGGPNQLDNNVKLKRDDFFYSSGGGVDFYLPYFKLGLEIKLIVGTKNLLKAENSVFTNSLEKVRSRMVVFSVTFEG